MKDIELVKIKRIESEPGLFCFDDCVASMANYYGCDYQMMFNGGIKIFRWEREYFAERYEIRLMDLVANLKKFHGLELIELKNLEQEEYHKLIVNNFEKGKPMIVHFDTFWCPWDPMYQNVSSVVGHYFIISKINNDNILCSDPYFGKELEPLSLELFYKGIRSVYLIEYNEINTVGIMRGAVIDTCREILSNNIITQLYDLIEDISIEENLFNGLSEDKELWSAPLIVLLMLINQFLCVTSLEVEYVAEKVRSDFLKGKAELLWDMAIQWKQVRKLIVKLYFIRKNDVKLKKMIVEKMKGVVSSLEKVLVEISNNSVIRVNLCDAFNNTAFSKYNGITIDNRNADFTTVGHIYICEKDMMFRCSQEYVSYEFQNIFLNEPDNICCEGQKIEIPRDIYSMIYIVGAAEFGGSTDILVVRDYNYSKNIKITLTDYIYEPQYGENVVWKGRGLYMDGEQCIEMSEHLYLYEKGYELETIPINEIVLPINPSIHIFAITLVK